MRDRRGGGHMRIDEYTHLVEMDLLPQIHLTAISPYNPILVYNRSNSWKTIGAGNYAGVFAHDSKPEWVVKVYGRNQEELLKEIDVYRKLGNHASFSALYAYGKNYLVLQKLEGHTLFDAVVKGEPIPVTVIEDIDAGLEYAQSVGLNPYDVHGKNVVMNQGRGYIVDVSDFYKQGVCRKWRDLKKAYYKIYQPYIYKYHPPIPFFIMEGIRKGYRIYRKSKKVRE
jgi:hypothetical protein